MTPPRTGSRAGQGSYLCKKHVFASLLLLVAVASSCLPGLIASSKQPQVSVTLIVPQSFRVPTNEFQGEKNAAKMQQYVALVNNVHSELEDEILRQKYKKLTLQIRDARTPLTGQLFYEHVFDYFPSRALLLPVSLEQVSAGAGGYEAGSGSRVTTSGRDNFLKPQQLIVSIRPYQLNSGFGSDTIEFASSAPVPVEPVPSYDGRRSFAVLQTDKPIYKPDEPVRIRSLVVNENLRPVTGDELRLQIKNPQKIIVEEIKFPLAPPTGSEQNAVAGQPQQSDPANPEAGQLFLDHVFRFPPEPMLGAWTVHLLHADPIANDTTSFEVREYVLPTFEVHFEPPKYILPSTQNITGAIVAKYHYGQPVQGKAYFKFGYKETLSSKPKFIARSSIKTIDPISGRVEFRMSAAKIQEMSWFPTIGYSKFVIEATVTETSTGYREVVQDSQCTFIPYPYYVSFEESADDFKPRLSHQPLIVQLLEMQTHRPAPEGARIVAQYLDQNGAPLQSNSTSEKDKLQSLEQEAFTDSSGRATFRLGPIRPEVSTIQVKLRWLNSSEPLQFDQAGRLEIPKELELAVGHHTLIRHESSSGWVSILNKQTSRLNVGDQFISDIALQEAVVRPQEIFYVITSRGQILGIDSISQSDGLIRFTITEQMVPGIRLVLFARSSSASAAGSIIADSMRISVSSSLNCGLKMRYKSSSVSGSGSVKPNDRGKLAVKARQGDLVSIIGVDSAVYTLNNRTRLDAFKVMQRVRRLDPGCGFGGGRNDLDVFHNAGLLLFTGSNLARQEQPAGGESAFLGSACLTVLNQMRLLEDTQLGYSRPMFSATAAQANRPRILDLAASVRQRLLSSGQSMLSLDPYAMAAGADTRGHLSKRRLKRELDVESLIRAYGDSFSRSCCRLGTLEDIPQRRSCSVRKGIVEKYMSHQFQPVPTRCSQIYFRCCQLVFEQIAVGNLAPTSRAAAEETLVVRGHSPSLSFSKSRASSNDFNVGHLDKIELETLVRRDFRETWLFELLEIREPDGSGALDVQLPHSITSWSIGALALNRFQPMCLMERPLKLTTFQEIFIQLSMPYKVVQGEQIDLVATIFNYSPEAQEVLVYMYGLEEVCSEAEPGERSERKRFKIERFASQAVLFPLIPLKIGKYPIKIVATTMNASSPTSDSIERQLNVVARGKVVTDETTFSLDPMNHQRRSKRAIQTGNLVDEIDSAKGVQRSKVRLTPSRDAELIVPQSQECIVSAIGDRLGQTIQTSIVDVENLIRLPHGCGEQVMIYLGPTLYTTHYLHATDRLSGDLRWKAIRYIQGGYKRILNYRKESGAFSAFARREPSIWLTAFIAKMLCQTERTPFVAPEVHIDKNVIKGALEWLLGEQDAQSGAWTEVNPVYHREMLGGVLRENALTAFIALTLNECAHHALDLIEEKELGPNSESGQPEVEQQSSFAHNGHSNGLNKLKLATQRAEKMLLLEKYKASKERNAYVLALTAYALSFNKPLEAVEIVNDLINIADRSYAKNHLFWKGDYNIETAAYALQAIVELGPLANQHLTNGPANNKIAPSPWQRGLDAISIANWLSSRRSFTGAFESTQDTVVALEALSKFAQLQATPNNNLLPPPAALANSSLATAGPSQLQPSLLCNVTMANNTRTRRSLAFRSDNAQILQTFKMDSFDIDTLNGEMLDIVTSGNGLGTMSVKLKYNVFQEEDELCRFDISSFIEEWQPPKLPSLPLISHDDLKLVDLDQVGENSSVPSTTTTNEHDDDDDPFRPFDKSMLGELNVINLHQLESQPLLVDQAAPAAKRREPKRELRTRRATHPVLDLSAQRGQPEPESWTSRLVASIRQSLPAWMKPATIEPAPEVARVSPARKTSTARRSPQPTQAPLIVAPTASWSAPPPSSHMNQLSKETTAGSQADQPQSGQNIAPAASSNPRLVLLLKICVNYMYKRDSEMAVIEVGILSGFRPNEADLEEIKKEVGGLVMHIETSADKSMLVIYMKYIPSSGPYCLQFRLNRNTLVYNLQSGYVRAYEYYSPMNSCSNIYTPSRVTNLLETKCDSSGQVCECATRSLCPATKKLLDLGEIYSVNATSGRQRMIDLVCSKKYDLISLVKLKNVRYLESGKLFKLSVRVKWDLTGNLTAIMETQRQQKFQSLRAIRKPSSSHVVHFNASHLEPGANSDQPEEAPESSLDLLNLTIDSSCVHDDPLLLHLAHPNQLKQGGDLVLFARHRNLEKRFHKVTSPKQPASQSRTTNPNYNSAPVHFPRPKANVLRGLGQNDEPGQQQEDLLSLFEDAQQFQYSLGLKLDKDSILHDITYQATSQPRETIKNLILWLDLRSKREKWACPAA